MDEIHTKSDRIVSDIENMQSMVDQITDPQEKAEYQRRLSGLQNTMKLVGELTNLQKKENASGSNLISFLTHMNSTLTKMVEEQGKLKECGEDTQETKDAVQARINELTSQFGQISGGYIENSRNKREKFNEVFSSLSHNTDE